MKTVYCVTVESQSSGAVDWYPTRDEADCAYAENLKEFGELPGEELNLFALEVEDDATADDITADADDAMMAREYVPLQSHNRGASLGETEGAYQPPTSGPRIVLDDQALATILAALRYYQANGQGEPDNRDADIHEIATNGGDVVSLDADGIDGLCEYLGTEPESSLVDTGRKAA